MFNWKKKLLSSLDINKQEKVLDKNKTVEVAKLISKRLFDINKKYTLSKRELETLFG